MDQNSQKQSDQQSSDTEKNNEVAVPYIPPPPPDESQQKRFRTPLVNGMIFAAIILMVGFMAYNYAGHALTRLAADSYVAGVTPTPLPSATPSSHPSTTPTP